MRLAPLARIADDRGFDTEPLVVQVPEKFVGYDHPGCAFDQKWFQTPCQIPLAAADPLFGISIEHVGVERNLRPTTGQVARRKIYQVTAARQDRAASFLFYDAGKASCP